MIRNKNNKSQIKQNKAKQSKGYTKTSAKEEIYWINLRRNKNKYIQMKYNNTKNTMFDLPELFKI